MESECPYRSGVPCIVGIGSKVSALGPQVTGGRIKCTGVLGSWQRVLRLQLCSFVVFT